MQFIFLALIAVGIVLLIFSVKLVRKTFLGNVVLELPYLKKSAEFEVTRPGTYTIWHKGQYFTRAPLDEFKPEITSRSTGEIITLTPSLFRPNANNGRTARMELFRFTAPAGKYVIELIPGSSISVAERRLIRLIPAKKVNPEKYFIQVRESQPRIIAFLGILLISIAAICLIFGLVFGILADQIFSR